MVIMALDHVRELYHVTALTQNPTDLAVTTPALFFTRWVTHLCAPTFVFLSGTSAYLSMQKVADRRRTRHFLLTRGLWLIVLEFTLVNFGIWFDIRFSVLLFQVIAAIGIGFVLLGLSIRCTPKCIGLLGLSVIFLHNVFPFLPLSQLPVAAALLNPLFTPNVLPIGGTTLIIGYPPIPWVALLFAGFGLGAYVQRADINRPRLWLLLGMVSLLLFVVLRAVNGYGDPAPWATHDRIGPTVMSFLNVTKYPPSLLFCLLMLGLMFLLLAVAERVPLRYTAAIADYGKVPLFYYVLHWYLIHIGLFAVLLIQGFQPSDFRFGFRFGRPEEGGGLDLLGVYVVWIAAVACLYIPCKRYAAYKLRHPEKKWLRYL